MQHTTTATIKCPGCGSAISVSASVDLDDHGTEHSHWTVLNDGKSRWVVVDDRSDALAPVYRSQAEAYAALDRFICDNLE